MTPFIFAATITLGWSPHPDYSDYKCHYGIGSGNYTEVVDVGSATNCTLPNLQDDTEYCFAVQGDDGPLGHETCTTTPKKKQILIAVQSVENS